MLSVINITAEFTSAVFLGVILLSILLQKEMRDIKTKLFFAAVGSEYGSGSEVLSLLAAAEQKMYTDKNRYYDTRKLPRRRINV